MINWLKGLVRPVVESPSKLVPLLKICLALWELGVGIWVFLPFDSFSPAEIGPWVNEIGEYWVGVVTFLIGLGILLSTLQVSYKWMKNSLFASFCWTVFVFVAYVVSDSHNIFIVSVVASLAASVWLYLHTAVEQTHTKSDNLPDKDKKDTISTL